MNLGLFSIKSFILGNVMSLRLFILHWNSSKLVYLKFMLFSYTFPKLKKKSSRQIWVDLSVFILSVVILFVTNNLALIHQNTKRKSVFHSLRILEMTHCWTTNTEFSCSLFSFSGIYDFNVCNLNGCCCYRSNFICTELNCWTIFSVFLFTESRKVGTRFIFK